MFNFQKLNNCRQGKFREGLPYAFLKIKKIIKFKFGKRLLYYRIDYFRIDKNVSFLDNKMVPQTETKTSAGFKAGVKDYRLTYYTPDYVVSETDILAAFRMTPQPGVPPEECGAAVAAESSTGTWTTVWTDGLTSLDKYKGRCYDLEPVPGEENVRGE